MLRRPPACTVGALLLVVLSACGGRSAISRGDAGDAVVGPPAEECDGLDQDHDGRVDENFRDEQGRYVANAHCGTCGHACKGLAHATDVACEVIDGIPSCAARECEPGFGRSRRGACVPADDHLCLSCRDDGDCGTLASAVCVAIDGEPRCARACGAGCPAGYVCVDRDHCEPDGGSCSCTSAQPEFSVACTVGSAGPQCVGSALCSGGVLGECAFPAERCDGIDNDCDERVDEGFVDELAAYSLDVHNCGACGIDCTADNDAGIELACGGDPFAPSCVSACPDTQDGIQVGDQLDADRRLSNGCECTVAALQDPSGKSASGALDANCDGADGDVLASFYVSVAGDDAGPGSPTRPLRSINVAIDRAAASLITERQRPHVYVASGVYTESVRMRDGVFLHGGYRSDFLAQSPSGFEVVVVAPSNTTAFGGAALTASDVGVLPTLIEGFSFRGRDALSAGAPAVGMELRDPGSKLIVRDVRVRSGKPGSGVIGVAGVAGKGPSQPAGDGEPPRPAIENASHACIAGEANRARGGSAGVSACGSVDASGGTGASAGCPVYAVAEPTGDDGRAPSGGVRGRGGKGGSDLQGPITNNPVCSQAVCCGLADFDVPGVFVLPNAGGAGGDGTPGTAGDACTDPIGSLAEDDWQAASAGNGSAGAPGAGGGGGGAGGGVVMAFFDDVCEFPDGLGGAGGGGGGGGCGGLGGRAGASGGPAIGVLLRSRNPNALPSLKELEILTYDGGTGGDGGAGGDGGQGGSGGFGGQLLAAERTTPPLAGPVAGERGGKGGDGGPGGGGGGGCGGSSIGIWLTGLGDRSDLASMFSDDNTFVLGAGGAPGRGGGGAKPADDGAAGQAIEVWVR